MITTHVFLDDGAEWLDRIQRCAYIVREHDERCTMPRQNRVHDVRDTTELDHEHRRRAGDGTDT